MDVDKLKTAIEAAALPYFGQDEAGRPTGAEVRELRALLGLTQVASARAVHVTPRMWQKYESGDSPIPPAVWELFLWKTQVLTAPRRVR